LIYSCESTIVHCAGKKRERGVNGNDQDEKTYSGHYKNTFGQP